MSLLLKRLLNKFAIGQIYERQAEQFLKQQGLNYVAKNYHCRYGEIDLIFSDPSCNILIFVEVRYRATSQFGGAAASITKQKQDKVKKAALFYLAQSKIEPQIRFDVIAIDGDDINWIQSAFS